MPDPIVPWCYYWNGRREPLFAMGVTRYVAEQVDATGHPLIGGKPVDDEILGPPPEGFRLRRASVWNPQTMTKRQLTVFSLGAPLMAGPVAGRKIQLREKDGSTNTYHVT